MAIECYSGTPGSGKSYDVARHLIDLYHSHKHVICNFPVNEKLVKKHRKNFPNAQTIYLDNADITVDYFVAFAHKYHKIGVENQCYVYIDEAQILVNCRDFAAKDRMSLIAFFSQHRHYGYNFILITQSIRMIDRQIRNLVETEVVHRKINNYGIGGKIITLLLWRPVFAAVSKWTGGNGLVTNREHFIFQASTAKLYDSYRIFNDLGDRDPEAIKRLLSCGISQT